MQTITIPEKAKKERDLIAISRKEYETLVRAQKPAKAPIIVKRSPSFRVAKKHEPFYDALDKELTESLKDYEAGRYYGPFDAVEDGVAFLKSYKAKRAEK